MVKIKLLPAVPHYFLAKNKNNTGKHNLAD